MPANRVRYAGRYSADSPHPIHADEQRLIERGSHEGNDPVDVLETVLTLDPLIHVKAPVGRHPEIVRRPADRCPIVLMANNSRSRQIDASIAEELVKADQRMCSSP